MFHFKKKHPPKLFRYILGTLVLIPLITAGIESTSATEVKLKAASFLPARSVYAKYFYNWVEHLNRECEGNVAITVVGPEAIKSLEQWRTLKDGIIDLHYGPPNYYRGALAEGDVTSLANTGPTEQRKNGAWDILNQLHNEKLNAWYLTHIGDGVQFFLYTTQPDENGRFDGFRLRSTPIYDDFFETLGAKPVRMSPPSLYTALERGTVDGYGWPLWGITDLGWHEHTKYRYGPGFFNAVINILVNLDRWNSLLDSQRQCLTSMSIWLEQEFPKWRNAENEIQQEALSKAGILYVDLGSSFSTTAHEIYWDKLLEENASIVSTLRPLLVK